MSTNRTNLELKLIKAPSMPFFAPATNRTNLELKLRHCYCHGRY